MSTLQGCGKTSCPALSRCGWAARLLAACVVALTGLSAHNVVVQHCVCTNTSADWALAS